MTEIVPNWGTKGCDEKCAQVGHILKGDAIMAFSMLGAMGDYMAEKTREIVKIDLANIAEDENNDFEVTGSVEIEKKNALLKDSIEQFGLLDPLIVRPVGGGSYKLISGHRRKLMHERLVAEGKTEFQKADCVIIDADETDAEQMLLEANLPNRVISDWEKMQAVKRMNHIFQRRAEAGEKISGRRRGNIAAALGMSVSAVGRLEKIEKSLTDEYKQEYKDGNISTGVADKLASRPEEEQKALHAAKGAKVKLSDLQGNKLPEETKPCLQGIPENASAGVTESDTSERWTLSSGWVKMPESQSKQIRTEMAEKGIFGVDACKRCHNATRCKGCCRVCRNKCNEEQECGREAAKNHGADVSELDTKNEPQERENARQAESNAFPQVKAHGYELAACSMEKALADLYEQRADAIDNGGDEETINALQVAINHIDSQILKTRRLAQDEKEQET